MREVDLLIERCRDCPYYYDICWLGNKDMIFRVKYTDALKRVHPRCALPEENGKRRLYATVSRCRDCPYYGDFCKNGGIVIDRFKGDNSVHPKCGLLKANQMQKLVKKFFDTYNEDLFEAYETWLCEEGYYFGKVVNFEHCDKLLEFSEKHEEEIFKINETKNIGKEDISAPTLMSIYIKYTFYSINNQIDKYIKSLSVGGYK